MLSDIKVFKLVTGEVIIGQLAESDSENIDIINPITIQVMQNPNTGEVQVGAQPWPEFIDESVKRIKLKRDKLLVSPYDPMDKLKNMYNAQFGSGLVLPTKSSRLEL